MIPVAATAALLVVVTVGNLLGAPGRSGPAIHHPPSVPIRFRPLELPPVPRTHRIYRRLRPYSTGSVWDRLAQCESSGNWAANTGNGFYGGLQFTLQTWLAYGGSGMPYNASRETQISVARRVLAGQGWAAWPTCSARLGLR